MFVCLCHYWGAISFQSENKNISSQGLDKHATAALDALQFTLHMKLS